MKRTVLLTGTAVAALISAMPAMAQEQKKNEAPPAAHQQPHAAPPQAAPRPAQHQEAPAQNRAAPAPRAHVEPSQPPNRGAAQRPEPNRGQAQVRPEPNKGPDVKSAQPRNRPENKPENRQATTPPAKQPERNGMPPAKSAERRPEPGREPGRDVRISEQQKVAVHRDVFKERNINRVKSVNVAIRPGSRVPRSVRLAVLPAAIVALVPAYSAYRYFVVNDDICIVEPNTYEIVDVIAQPGGAAYATLTLTPQERDILLRNIELSSGRSTLGLGALNEGSPVPGGIALQDVPFTVFERVPKLQGYHYFVTEGRVALVDPAGSTIQLVIELN